MEIKNYKFYFDIKENPDDFTQEFDIIAENLDEALEKLRRVTSSFIVGMDMDVYETRNKKDTNK